MQIKTEQFEVNIDVSKLSSEKLVMLICELAGELKKRDPGYIDIEKPEALAPPIGRPKKYKKSSKVRKSGSGRSASYTEEQKAEVLRYHEGGMKARQIMEEGIKLPVKTIYNIIDNFKKKNKKNGAKAKHEQEQVNKLTENIQEADKEKETNPDEINNKMDDMPGM